MHLERHSLLRGHSDLFLQLQVFGVLVLSDCDRSFLLWLDMMAPILGVQQYEFDGVLVENWMEFVIFGETLVD